MYLSNPAATYQVRIKRKPQGETHLRWNDNVKRVMSLLRFTLGRRAQNSCGGYSAGFHCTCLLSRKNL